MPAMKQQIIYVHGGDSFSRQEDFLTFLRTTPLRDSMVSKNKPQRWTESMVDELGDDFEVYMPSMPNKHNARYEEWVIWFERHLELVADGVCLVGWSLGGMFLVKYLSENPLRKQVSAAFILAAPGGNFSVVDGIDADCADFRPHSEKVNILPQNVSRLEFWHSQDDFVVSITELAWYREHVPGAIFRVFNDKNHFLLPKLPELIAALKNL